MLVRMFLNSLKLNPRLLVLINGISLTFLTVVHFYRHKYNIPPYLECIRDVVILMDMPWL